MVSPGISLNVADEFSRLAQQRADAPAVVVARHAKPRSAASYERLSFGRCLELADAYTCGLRECGIERYDTALILMKSMQDLAPVFLALWKIGAVPLVFDGGGARQQKLRLIEEAAPKALIGIPISHALRVYYRKAFGSVSHSVSTGHFRFGVPTLGSFLRRRRNGSPTSVPSTADDPVAIVFTSGSTGPPKGVVYTHGNGVAIAEAMKESLAVGPGDVCLSGHPAFAMHFLGTGATVVVPGFDPRYPLRADPAALLDVIRHQKPAVAFLQLSLLRNLWRHCAARGDKIPYLRKILTTGASVGLDLVEGLHACLAEPEADLHIMYGATEALCISYATGRDLLARAAETRGGRGTYLGRPSSGVRVRIIGITPRPLERWNSSLTLPAREIGEICVWGPVVTPEYKDRPEATRRAKIPDGDGLWHRMGDAGYIDEDGDLWLCGRIADRVETEAGNLYPDLVEPVFNQHPQVARSALVGAPAAGSLMRRPVVLIESEPGAGGSLSRGQRLSEELRSLASRHPSTRNLRDITISKTTFPVDIRHYTKIRRDLLTRQIGQSANGFSVRQAALFRGYRVAYCEKGRGEPILFLHNAGNDHSIWEYQIEHFSQKHRVIAADSLGYGCSDNPAVDYSLPLYTEMVAALVDSLSLAPVSIVGSCTGAAMALNYALQNPRKVKRLILFHIATEGTAAGGSLERTIRLVGGRPFATRVISPFVEAAMSRGALHKRIIRDQYGCDFADTAVFLEHMHRLYGKRGQATCLLRLFGNWKSFAPLDKAACPADFPPLHVFWGDSNRVLPLKRGQKLRESLRPHSWEVIEGGGHLVMRERPELVNRRMDEIMQSTDRL